MLTPYRPRSTSQQCHPSHGNLVENRSVGDAKNVLRYAQDFACASVSSRHSEILFVSFSPDEIIVQFRLTPFSKAPKSLWCAFGGAWRTATPSQVLRFLPKPIKNALALAIWFKILPSGTPTFQIPNKIIVTSSELKLGYELVFTVTDYLGGPRKGIANFQGNPHFYECVFDEVMDEYSDLYRLTPLNGAIFDLAREDWAIWQRWNLAFHTGKQTIESHPALPQDRARHEQIRDILGPALKTDRNHCIIRAGLFETIGTSELPKGVQHPLQVGWTEPKHGSRS